MQRRGGVSSRARRRASTALRATSVLPRPTGAATTHTPSDSDDDMDEYLRSVIAERRRTVRWKALKPGLRTASTSLARQQSQLVVVSSRMQSAAFVMAVYLMFASAVSAIVPAASIGCHIAGGTTAACDVLRWAQLCISIAAAVVAGIVASFGPANRAERLAWAAADMTRVCNDMDSFLAVAPHDPDGTVASFRHRIGEIANTANVEMGCFGAVSFVDALQALREPDTNDEQSLVQVHSTSTTHYNPGTAVDELMRDAARRNFPATGNTQRV